MRTLAPARSSPSIFPAAISPPPITTTFCLPASQTWEINSSVIPPSTPGFCPLPANRVPRPQRFAGQNRTDLFVGLLAQKCAQIFIGPAFFLNMFKIKSFDRVGNIGCRAAVSDRTRDGSNLANASSDAEVVGVDHFSVRFYFLAFDADVSDPMLSATVRAASDVQLYLFGKSGKPVFEFGREPAREPFCFSECEFAKFGTGASDGAACKSRNVHRQSGSAEFAGDGDGVLFANVREQQILLNGGAKLPSPY